MLVTEEFDIRLRENIKQAIDRYNDDGHTYLIQHKGKEVISNYTSAMYAKRLGFKIRRASPKQ